MGGLLSPSWFFCQFWSQLSSFLTLDAPPCCPMMFLVEAGLYLSTHMRASSDLLLSSWEEMDCVLGEEVLEDRLPLSCSNNKYRKNELKFSKGTKYLQMRQASCNYGKKIIKSFEHSEFTVIL